MYTMLSHSVIHLYHAILQDMMLFLNWTRAAILYEDEYGLIRLQELVRFIRFACIIQRNTNIYQ